jgi:hypothetical protein
MSDAEEIAKAVQEVAKFGSNSVESANRAGSFIARVFKAPIDEVAGIVHDKLRFVRWRRLISMGDEVNKILEDRGVKESRAVPPKLALPIFEEATLEEDESLQALWNQLLANAMDPSFNGELRYGFTDMIKNITGVEAKFLSLFYDVLRREQKLANVAHVTEHTLKKEQLMSALGIDEITYQVSAFNLMRMQCIAPAILKGGAMLGNEPMTIYKGTDVVTLTPLGVRFIEACIAKPPAT